VRRIQTESCLSALRGRAEDPFVRGKKRHAGAAKRESLIEPSAIGHLGAMSCAENIERRAAGRPDASSIT